MNHTREFRRIVNEEITKRNIRLSNLSRDADTDQASFWRFMKDDSENRGINFETVAKILKTLDLKFAIFDGVKIKEKPVEVYVMDTKAALPIGSGIIDNEKRIKDLEAGINSLQKDLRESKDREVKLRRRLYILGNNS